MYALQFAIVVGLVAVGESATELGGVLNLGHEGMMLLGGAVGLLAAFTAGNPWVGLLAAAGTGILLGVVKAAWSVSLKTDQVIVGLMVAQIGAAVADVAYIATLGRAATPPRLTQLAPVHVPVLSDLPLLGVLFNRSLAFYVGVIVAGAVAWWVMHSRSGMVLRATGESPETVDFNGINVDRARWAGVLVGSCLSGLAGGLLVIDHLQLYHEGITAGRGWIAIAIVMVSGWNPKWCLVLAFGFGIMDMLQFQVQLEAAPIPHELLVSLPYLATVGVLALRGSRWQGPAALAVPYRKG